jgi:enoyl-[acyl-carrier-protein] reductase (NADH)
LLDKAKAKAPARSLVSIDDVGVTTAFLAHDAARLITGETLYVDGGYHIMYLLRKDCVSRFLIKWMCHGFDTSRR